ncbi:MAG: recombinase family protein, partial [Candidatus Pacebacteria bacterium]|nr:recombinase family protein [Candidatus Paceibacterota bacterium]
FLKEAKSAKNPNKRARFMELIELLEKEEVDTILVWNPDRLSRNSIDSGRLLYLMDTGKLKEIVTPTQTFRNTPNDKFLLNILWGQAKFDNDNKGLNVIRGMNKKLELGWFPFVAPIGYLNTPEKIKGEKIIVEDPERFHVIQKLWDLMLTGNYTVPEVRNIAVNTYKLRSLKHRNSGGGFVSRSNMYEMFKNPFYYGWFKVKDKWYQGSHKPMITKNEYDKVQEMLGRTDSRRPKKHTFAYTGLIKCFHCGCSISATRKFKSYKKTKNNAVYEYYHCTKKKKDITCLQKPVKPQDIDSQVALILEIIQIHPDFRDWALRFLKEYRGAESNLNDDVKRNLQRELDRVNERLSNLLNLKLDGLINDEEYLLKKKEISEQGQDVKSKILGYESDRNDWYKKAEEAINFAFNARKEFEKANDFKKRELLTKVGSNFFLNDGILCYDLQKPFFLFRDMNLLEEPKIEWLEPLDYAFVTTKVGYSEPENPLWLPRVDSNHEP